MKKGLLLTPRDIGLLKDLHDSVVLSFAQVQGRHFAALSRPTVSNRLAKLRRAGLVFEQKVSLAYGSRVDQVGAVFGVSTQGLKILASRCPESSIRNEPMRINVLALNHDLLLTEVITALAKRFPAHRLVNGRHFPSTRSEFTRLPDAVMIDATSAETVAVELELTAKSERRYRDIILQYRLDSRFKEVLYVTASPTIERKIRCQILGGPQIMSGQDTGKFTFMPLPELIRTQTKGNVNAAQYEVALSPNWQGHLVP